MTNFKKLINDWENNYSDLPLEVYLKQDILRQGLCFDTSSFKDPNYKKKDYFIFSFDRVPLQDMKQSENWKAPEEIRMSGGPFQMKKTVVSVRINPASPYVVLSENSDNTVNVASEISEPTSIGGVEKNSDDNLYSQLKLFYSDEVSKENEYICDLEFPPIPDYYNSTYKMEKPIGEIAPVIEWGYLIYLTVFRNCQYFGKEEECQFCDINHNWRQQKKSGRPYTGIKPIEYILEALTEIDRKDSIAKAYTLTGGSVVASLQGKNEIDFYGDYAKAINEKFPDRWISKVVTQAHQEDELKKLKDYGVSIYHPNYEVWDAELFKILCPGKERYVGRDVWNERILSSVKVFGHENVIPNFVAGVEVAGKYGIKSVNDAVKSTLEGVEYFMSHGISPRFTTWCPEPYTMFGDEPPAPLDYYMKLLRGYLRIWNKFKLPVPPGYGPPGLGKAVFSVSAFMDILPERDI